MKILSTQSRRRAPRRCCSRPPRSPAPSRSPGAGMPPSRSTAPSFRSVSICRTTAPASRARCSTATRRRPRPARRIENGDARAAARSLPDHDRRRRSRTAQLVGKVQMRNDKDANGSPFRAVRHVPRRPRAGNVPTIAGVWEIPHESPKGEKAWRFIVKQYGRRAVGRDPPRRRRHRRADRPLRGRHVRDQPLRRLASVADARDAGRPTARSTIVQQGSNRDGTLIAYRPDVARAKGLPEPSNYTHAHDGARSERGVHLQLPGRERQRAARTRIRSSRARWSWPS